jgi:nucleoid DNA-binding protein
VSAFIGSALLRKLVAERAQVSEQETEKVLDAFTHVVIALVEDGAKVRCLGRGYFELLQTKASRRKSPMISGFVKVPAKRKIVFRESRKK